MQVPPESSEAFRRLQNGDQDALRELLDEYGPRLKRMIRLRMDPRLLARIDESDVLQDAMVDVSRRLDEYLAAPKAPFFLWIRALAGLKIAELHRRHLGSDMRDASREISIFQEAMPMASSHSLAAQLLGRFSSPSQAALKAERRLQLREALQALDAEDREVLALRHFEQLSRLETAQVLGLTEAGAVSRHMRALKRLKSQLEQIPGFLD